MELPLSFKKILYPFYFNHNYSLGDQDLGLGRSLWTCNSGLEYLVSPSHKTPVDSYLMFFPGNNTFEWPLDTISAIQEQIPHLLIIAVRYRGTNPKTRDIFETPTESLLVKDCLDIYHSCIEKNQINQDLPLYFYGQSLGGGIALGVVRDLIHHHKQQVIGGLILESTFASISKIASNFPGIGSLLSNHLPKEFLISNYLWVTDHLFDSHKKIRNVSDHVPKTLIFRAEYDDIVASFHSEDLYSHCKSYKKLVEVPRRHAECAGHELWISNLSEFFTTSFEKYRNTESLAAIEE